MAGPNISQLALDTARRCGARLVVVCGPDDTNAWAGFCREHGGQLQHIGADEVSCLAGLEQPIDVLHLRLDEAPDSLRELYRAARFAERAVLLLDGWRVEGSDGPGRLMVGLALADGFVPVAEDSRLLLVRGGELPAIPASPALRAAVESGPPRQLAPRRSRPMALGEVQRHFAGMQASPFMMPYLTRVLELCPRGGRALEAGFDTGLPSIWLSRRGVVAEGVDPQVHRVEAARQASNVLGGTAAFRTGELLDLYRPANEETTKKSGVG